MKKPPKISYSPLLLFGDNSNYGHLMTKLHKNRTKMPYNYESSTWNKFMKISMSVVLGLFLISLYVGGCTMLNKKLNLDDDHVGEEIVEELIKDKTGLDLDLSPESPEK